VPTTRLEAFSDGVIAVAITLLVLYIKVPVGHGALIHQLLDQWQYYVAYAVSFITIGIIWINHHVMISRLRETDHAILMLNLLLLMTIGLLPFTTDLIATYLKQGHGQKLAAGVYSGSLLLMALAFASLNRHLLLRKSHNFYEQLTEHQRRQILRRSTSGVIPYAIATVLALVSPYVTLAITAALAAFYALPIASGVERPA
jgi:uncharacterized membrane protein